MFEIKRLNRLWSNQSLYCKTEVFIPIFNENNSSEENKFFGLTTRNNKKISKIKQDQLKRGRSNIENSEDESLDQLLKRIDVSMRKTKNAIGRFDRMVKNDKSYDY